MINNYIKSMMLPINEDSFIVSDILLCCEEIEQESVINLWNGKIDENDKIFILGNFGFNIHDYGYKLKGKKILLMGPEDRNPKYDYFVNGFVEVISQFTFNFSRQDMQRMYDSLVAKKYKEDDNKLGFYKQLWNKDYASCYISDIGDKRFMFSHFSLNEIDEANSEIIQALNLIFKVTKCDLHINHETIKNYFSENGIKEPIRLKELVKKVTKAQPLSYSLLENVRHTGLLSHQKVHLT